MQPNHIRHQLTHHQRCLLFPGELLLFVKRVRPRVNQVFVFHLHHLSFSVIHTFLFVFAGPFFRSRTASPCSTLSPRLPSTPQDSSPVQSPRSINTSTDSEAPKYAWFFHVDRRQAESLLRNCKDNNLNIFEVSSFVKPLFSRQWTTELFSSGHPNTVERMLSSHSACSIIIVFSTY